MTRIQKLMGSTRKPVAVVEHRELRNVPLTPAQARAISAYRLTTTVDPSTSKKDSTKVLQVSPGTSPGLYNLKAGSVVGSLSVAGAQVNILPKVGVGKTAQMLAFTIGLARLLPDSAELDKADSFVELLVPAFLESVEQIVRGGLIEDYVSVTETGPGPRGRIDFRRLARTGLPIPVDYTYDSFSGDTDHNRLLARALHQVKDLAGLEGAIHSEARRLLGHFQDVAFTPWPSLFRGGHLADRSSHYRHALGLATLILEGAGIEPRGSGYRARGILFDMNKVFEGFVTALLRQVAPRGTTVDAQGSRHKTFLDMAEEHRMKPDIALWEDSVCRLVGDVKYKILSEKDGPRIGDLYQVASYAQGFEAERTLLVYAGESEGRDVIIQATGTRIEVRALDVSKGLTQIKEAFRRMVADMESAS